MKRIAVLGGGNGAQALAGHLASRGFPVTLFEHPEFRNSIRRLEETKTIELTGAIEARGTLEVVTTDPAAVREAEILYFLAPSFAQEAVFSLIAPYLREGQRLLLMPGNFGSLVLKDTFGGRLPEGFLAAESDTMPYACRIEAPGVVNVWGVKNFMATAALPASRTGDFIASVQDAFPVPLKSAPNVLSIGLSNTNMILHCPTMIMNAGRIESGNGRFRFYAEGMTDSVCTVMEAMDRERMAVGKALGLDLLSTMDDMKELYSIGGDTLRETILNNGAYCGHGPDSPASMKYRYLTEDVPFLLVPVFEIGKKLGIPLPVTESIIRLASVIAGEDYLATGRNLSRLDLDGVNG